MSDILALLAFVTVCGAAAAPGILFRPGSWYRNLAKPAWCPPDWLFGPVWAVLYVSIAVSGWLVWRQADAADTGPALAIYAVQLVLNAAWSAVFFGLRRPDLAFVEIIVFLASIVLTIIAFHPVSAAAAILLVPYAVWVAFASILNFSLWRLNPRRRSS